MQILKYPFGLGVDKLMIPIHGRGVLSVGMDYDSKYCLWVEVDPEGISVPIDVISFGTGFIAPDDDELQFVGTVIEGPYRWHVFVKRGGE